MFVKSSKILKSFNINRSFFLFFFFDHLIIWKCFNRFGSCMAFSARIKIKLKIWTNKNVTLKKKIFFVHHNNFSPKEAKLTILQFSDAASTLRCRWVFPTFEYGYFVLCVLLHGGYKGSISSGKGVEEAKLAFSHEVLHVVPTSRGAQDNQWRLWTGNTSSQPLLKTKLFI